MIVYVVQGEHWEAPGRPVSVHSTPLGAQARALELANLMRRDLDLPPASGHWEVVLRDIRAILAAQGFDPNAARIDVKPLDLAL